MLGNEIVLEAARSGFPFEVKEAVVLVVGGLPAREQQVLVLIVACGRPAALLQNPRDDV